MAAAPKPASRRKHAPDWEPPIPGRRRVLHTWDEYMSLAKRIIERFDHQFDLRHFDYHHPVRLQAFRADAQDSLDQWRLWGKVHCPVLLIHGMDSDALLGPTIRRMKKAHNVMVMHVPDTGHTPVLSDRNQNWFIHEWLMGSIEAREWTVLHAKLRDDKEPKKTPVRLVKAAPAA